MKKALLPLAVAAALSAGAAHAEFLDFTMDYGSVTGFPVSPYEVTGDKFNGGYDEVININTATGTYTTQAYIGLHAVYKDEGVNLSTPFETDESLYPGGFTIYAIFQSTGLYTGSNFIGNNGSFTLWIDPNQNTAHSFDGSGNVVLNGATTGDDYQIGGATLIDYLKGTAFTVPGAFDTRFSDFALTAAGQLFFVEPDPFYMVLRSNGDYDQFTVLSAPNPEEQDPYYIIHATGDVSAVFVPEPSSLALLGLGLTGLGFAMRRRKSA